MNRLGMSGAAAAGLLLAVSLNAAPVQAEFFVSLAGVDTNNCLIDAPCRSFQRAHNAASAGSVVSCLNFGNYGGFTITKSLIIDCNGTGAMITAGNVAVALNAPGIAVTLRGLTIVANGAGGDMGVLFLSGSSLHIDNANISGFRGMSRTGISFRVPAGTVGELHVTDSLIADNGTADQGGGIVILPGAGAIANVSIQRSKVQNNSFNIVARALGSGGGTRVSIGDTVASGAINSGIGATSTGAPINMTLSNVTSANNGTIGVIADGANTTIRLGNSTITGNQTFGALATSGGAVLSMKNNMIVANGNDGTPLPAFPGPGGTPLQ